MIASIGLVMFCVAWVWTSATKAYFGRPESKLYIAGCFFGLLSIALMIGSFVIWLWNHAP